MDDRDHHDTNVVSLRRKDDLRGRDQDQVASTIFAEQDEISTFSQGNLVPPTPPGQPVDQGPTRPTDPFFDKHLRQRSPDRELTSGANIDLDADEYFARLVAQSATEMADQLQERESPAVSLPGSASLPVHAARLRRHGWRLGVPLSVSRRHRGHASRSVVIFVATGLLTGAALALIIVSLGYHPPAAQTRGADPHLASMLSVDRNPFKLELHSSSRNAKAASRSRHVAQRRRTRAADRIRAAARLSRGRRSTTSTSVTSAPANASHPSSGSATGAPATTSPVTSAPAPQTSSSSSSGQAASSNNPPAFGPSGTLGPGHSSIG